MTIRLLSYVFVALIAFAGGFLVGGWNHDGSSSDTDAGAAAKMADTTANTADSAIPIDDSPILGKESALISVVEFSDFQCPYCKRGGDVVKQLQEKYPNDVKVVFKHYPLPFHKEAPAASKAAIAAGNQGKFWEMHDFLFDNQKELKSHGSDMKDWTAEYAGELGLDVAKYKKDFDAPETAKIIERDMALGEKVSVRGTPHFFVNGERVKGAKPLSAFEEIVKRQLKEAKEMTAAGVARGDIYNKMVAKNFDGAKPQPSQPSQPAKMVEMVPVDENDPVKGDADKALVTLVEFSSFQCGFCAKVQPTLDQIKEEYGDQVRIVFKQLPLGMQAQSKPAAQAALAAHEQGKFWEMHDKIFENQRQMRSHANDFKEWTAGFAKELGMNVDKFKQDYDSSKVTKKVESDLALSQKIGARGTPNFWINGVNLRGAQPFSAFKSEIDAQIKLAKKIKADKKVSGEKLYEALVAENKKNAPAAKPQPQAKPEPPAPTVDLEKLAAGDAPTKGPDNAPVTIVEFSDFQCPYCNKGGANMKEAAAQFGDQIQIVFKHYPLPFHKQARDAGKAAMAAGEQGKFWEMYDLLFENQRRLKEGGIFDELAEQLGLNMAKFKKDMQNPEYEKTIDADMKQGQAVGVRGTPAFFINGKRIVGAQPTAKFKTEIENALEEAKK